MENKTIKLLGDRVLVQELKSKENTKTASGIIIPETVTSSDIKRAKVIGVGPGLYTQNGVLIPMSVEVDDEVVMLPYHQGQEIKINNETYLIVRESDLAGILK